MDGNRSLQGYPGFRTKGLHTCMGSTTPQVRDATCDSATHDIAFPTKSQGRHLNQVISELNYPACIPPVYASPPPSRGADARLGAVAGR